MKIKLMASKIQKNFIKKRLNLSDQIKLNSDYSFGVVSPSVIDKINIHNASLLAMKKAIENLDIKTRYYLCRWFVCS